MTPGEFLSFSGSQSPLLCSKLLGSFQLCSLEPQWRGNGAVHGSPSATALPPTQMCFFWSAGQVSIQASIVAQEDVQTTGWSEWPLRPVWLPTFRQYKGTIPALASMLHLSPSLHQVLGYLNLFQMEKRAQRAELRGPKSHGYQNTAELGSELCLGLQSPCMLPSGPPPPQLSSICGVTGQPRQEGVLVPRVGSPPLAWQQLHSGLISGDSLRALAIKFSKTFPRRLLPVKSHPSVAQLRGG